MPGLKGEERRISGLYPQIPYLIERCLPNMIILPGLGKEEEETYRYNKKKD